MNIWTKFIYKVFQSRHKSVTEVCVSSHAAKMDGSFQTDCIIIELKEANLKHRRRSSPRAVPSLFSTPQRSPFLRQHGSLFSMSRIVMALWKQPQCFIKPQPPRTDKHPQPPGPSRIASPVAARCCCSPGQSSPLCGS